MFCRVLAMALINRWVKFCIPNKGYRFFSCFLIIGEESYVFVVGKQVIICARLRISRQQLHKYSLPPARFGITVAHPLREGVIDVYKLTLLQRMPELVQV